MLYLSGNTKDVIWIWSYGYEIDILFRFLDFFLHFRDEKKTFRTHWKSNNYRLISVWILAAIYALAFLNALNFTRIIKFFGFLRRIMIKAAFSVVQFLALFGLLMFAFTMSFTEIYWTNSMNASAIHFCEVKNSATNELCPTEDGDFENQCQKPIFTGFISTIADLFWALFGQFEIGCLRAGGANDENYFEDAAGLVLMALYHICIAFVLLNMLIALMSESVSKTSENKGNVWKLDRTYIWFRFIHRDCTAPSPMNIMPEFCQYFKNILHFCKIKTLCENGPCDSDDEKKEQMKNACKFSIDLVNSLKGSTDKAVQTEAVQTVFL